MINSKVIVMEYQIKTADLDEIRIMLEWARIEGWNPELDDASTFQKADPSGFFIGYLNGALWQLFPMLDIVLSLVFLVCIS